MIKPTRSRSAWARALVLAGALSLMPTMARAGDIGPDTELTFHLIDLGINQAWDDRMQVGDTFVTGPEGHGQVFAAPPRPTGQVLVPMLDDERLRTLSHEALVAEIAGPLRERIRNDIANGVHEFEIQFVQNINSYGYPWPHRQGAVKTFGDAAYEAFGQVLEEMRGQTRNIAVDGTFGSNGATMFAKSIEAWRGYSDLIQRVTWVDGRALEADARGAIDALGASKVRITNSFGDLPAMPLNTSGFLHSIANHDVARSLLADYAELTVLLLRPRDRDVTLGLGVHPRPACCHIRSATQRDARFEVTQYLPGNLKRDLGLMTGGDLHPQFGFRDYASHRGSVPTVGTSHARVLARPPRPAPPLIRLQVSRPAMEQLSSTMKTLADVLVNVYDFKDDPPLSETYGLVKTLHDFHKALELDLRLAGDGPWVIFRSHSLEQAGRFGLSQVIDSLETLRIAGKLGATFTKRITLATFGVEDIVTAAARHIGGGHADVETVTLYLDGLVKTSWGIVGYLVSGGNKAVGDTFAAVGGLAAEMGRRVTADAFTRAYARFHGIDRTLIDTYLQAQDSRRAHGIRAQSIEDFYDHDRGVLTQLSEHQRAESNAQFGLKSARLQARREPPRITTRHTTEHYREVCRRGFCTRIDLTAAGSPPGPGQPPPTSAGVQPAEPVETGGVWIDPRPESAGGMPPGLLDGLLSRRSPGAASWDLNP